MSGQERISPYNNKYNIKQTSDDSKEKYQQRGQQLMEYQIL